VDESNRSQNTVGFKIKVLYRFHPYFGEELEIFSKPRNRSGTFTVLDREGKSLKIPCWMTEEQSSHYDLKENATIHIESLLTLQSFIDFHFKNTGP
jgi:hypothetical protein